MAATDKILNFIINNYTVFLSSSIYFKVYQKAYVLISTS
jgi:hypothetical protein